jgi:hypothetical protein
MYFVVSIINVCFMSYKYILQIIQMYLFCSYHHKCILHAIQMYFVVIITNAFSKSYKCILLLSSQMYASGHINVLCSYHHKCMLQVIQMYFVVTIINVCFKSNKCILFLPSYVNVCFMSYDFFFHVMRADRRANIDHDFSWCTLSSVPPPT